MANPQQQQIPSDEALMQNFIAHLNVHLNFAAMDQRKYRIQHMESADRKAKMQDAKKRQAAAQFALGAINVYGFGHKDAACECQGCENRRQALAAWNTCECYSCKKQRASVAK